MPKWKDLGSKEGREKIIEAAKDLLEKGVDQLSEAKDKVNCKLNKDVYIMLARYEDTDCTGFNIMQYLSTKSLVKELTFQEQNMKQNSNYNWKLYQQPSEAECAYLKADAHAYLVKLKVDCDHTFLNYDYTEL